MPVVLMDMFRGRGLVCWGQARFSTRPVWLSTAWLLLSSAECRPGSPGLWWVVT